MKTASVTIRTVKTLCLKILAAVLLCSCFLVPARAEEPAEVFHMTGRSTLFNTGWTFQRTDISAEEEPVTLPHDWSIQEPFSTEWEAESGFLPGGTAVYRKNVIFPSELRDQRIVIEFGGVYMNAEVSVNGRKLGSHPYGYTGFSFDLTEDLILDGSTENLIEVAVRNELPSSRWYSGSGIYRDVRLVVTGKQYIAQNGIQIKPDAESGETEVKVTLRNDLDTDRNLVLENRILLEDRVVAQDEQTVSAEAGGSVTIDSSLAVASPKLWSLDDPVQYQCVSELKDEQGTVLDSVTTSFGYRRIRFDPQEGFYLNDEPVKLKGVCLHHDQGALGAASYDRAIERQLDILQAMGVNAVRSTHNPCDTHLLEECSRRGILVIEEAFDTWTNAKNYNFNDYSSIFSELIGEDNEILNGEPGMSWAQYDIRQMVLDSMNEPCVIL